MVCTRCGKKSASQYEVRAKGNIKTVSLCASCHEELYGDREEREFLDSLYGESGRAKSVQSAVCSACGTTLEEFRATGLVGCPACYRHLREQLIPTVRRIQGRLRHEGVAPSVNAEDEYSLMRSLVEERERLKEQLEGAMRSRDFARAEQLKELLLQINHKLYRGEGV